MINKNHNLIFLPFTILFTLFICFTLILPGCSLPGANTAAAQISAESGPDNLSEGQDMDVSAEAEMTTQKDPEASTGTDQEQQKNILKGFKLLQEENKEPDELIRYIDENIAAASLKTAGSLFESLEKSQKYYMGVYMDNLFEGNIQQVMMETFTTGEEFIKENLDKISDNNIKNLITRIFAGGFKLVALEGSFYPIIDYSYLKKYSSYLDEEYNDYIYIKSWESDEIYTRDAGLMISWDELARRMIDAENYLVKYPQETPRKIEAGKLYLGYLSSYIYGQDNTPTRDYQTSKVFDQVISSYEKLINENPDTLSGEIVAQYLSVLQKNGFILSDDILNTLDKYLKMPIDKFNLDSEYMLHGQIKNLGFPADLSESGYATLRDGQYIEKQAGQSGGQLSIFLLDYFIGDLNGDDIDDAAVIIVANTGSRKAFYYLHAVQNAYFYTYATDPEFLGEWLKIESLKIEDGKIHVSMVVQKPDGPICYACDPIIRVFKLQEGQLVEEKY